MRHRPKATTYMGITPKNENGSLFYKPNKMYTKQDMNHELFRIQKRERLERYKQVMEE